MELQIKPEFHNLIPPLSDEEYQLLEESILKEGCREKIIIKILRPFMFNFRVKNFHAIRA